MSGQFSQGFQLQCAWQYYCQIIPTCYSFICNFLDCLMSLQIGIKCETVGGLWRKIWDQNVDETILQMSVLMSTYNNQIGNWDIARKKNDFLLFSIVLWILQLLITLEPLVFLIQVVFSKMCISKWVFKPIENWKCHIFDFGLISLDRTTYECWVCFLRCVFGCSKKTCKDIEMVSKTSSLQLPKLLQCSDVMFINQ